MALGGVPSRKLHAAFAAALALVASLSLAACAASPSYAGIPLGPDAAEASLQELARLARRGDKQAQLELGILYEEGLRLPRDLDRARTLYRAAASNGGGADYVYAPPVGGKGPGQLIRVPGRIARPGLQEARLRLEALKAQRRGALR